MEVSWLPEECIAVIISFTSPKEASRLALVSRLFKTASESDVVWDKFLPSDYKDLISQSINFPPQRLNSMPKKTLYFHLCETPLIIADGNMSFQMEKESGKKGFMVGARRLSIIWGEESHYWRWKSIPDSRFSQVTELMMVWWLDVSAHVETRILSPETGYTAYLVFKLSDRNHTFERKPVQLHVHLAGQGQTVWAHLGPASSRRGDGWDEVALGDFFNEKGEDGAVSCQLLEHSCSDSWSGLTIEGIELRPKRV